MLSTSSSRSARRRGWKTIQPSGWRRRRPAIEERLAELRSLWDVWQGGERFPGTPDDEPLYRALVRGLDVAREANLALARWQTCLDRLDEIEQVQRALGTGEHEIAITRTNRHEPLRRLGKLDEARAVLEGCLEVFRRAGDMTREARVLSVLATVWNALGDPGQALALARQALALGERLPNPGDRAISHESLAISLHATGSTAEASAHQLAAISYRLVTGFDIRLSTPQLADRIREAATRGEGFAFPALSALLAEPAFAPLGAFLRERAVDVVAFQSRIDGLVAETQAKG
jgi:tetratricopeptide (TPR) repeat protein